MRRVYLDNNATTPVASEVFEAMKPYLLDDYGNASSIHWYGQRAKAAIEQSREQLASLLNARSSEIVFTSGGTESDNTSLFGMVGASRSAARHVITTTIEHSAVLYAAKELEKRGVQVYWVDRGGDVTYHGPGQLVGYPLLPLAPGGLYVEAQSGKARLPRADYVGYLRKLEDMLIGALLKLGVAGAQVPGLTGVWVQPDVFSRCQRCPPNMRRKPAKIAAIGVKVDAQGISRHGFALNVDPDMTYWDGIVGCGIKDYPVASLADLLHPVPSREQVRQAVIQAFRQEFNYQVTQELQP